MRKKPCVSKHRKYEKEAMLIFNGYMYTKQIEKKQHIGLFDGDVFFVTMDAREL